MKVEHKKKKTTFQEISSELKEYRTLPDGTYSKEGDSVTVRSNDATDMIEARLGVSQAVLQHVIFCHQEESTWPLGDASTVKKIFDNIFEATRSVACGDGLYSMDYFSVDCRMSLLA